MVTTTKCHYQFLFTNRFHDKGTVPYDEKHRRRDETGKKCKKVFSKRYREVSEQFMIWYAPSF
jgi:hypothetical protein